MGFPETSSINLRVVVLTNLENVDGEDKRSHVVISPGM